MLTKRLNNLVRLCLLLLPSILKAQNLRLEEAQQQARANYPAIRQKELLRQTAQLSIQNLNKGYLPQIAFTGQATYQSDVTSVPVQLPGLQIDPPSRDQYKAIAEASQLIYDGGLIKNQKQLQRLNSETEDQRVEVDLYKIGDRVNQLYLTILLLDEQLKQAELVKKDLQTGIHKTEALLENGLVFRSNLNSLEAEFLKADQRSVELKASRKGFIKTLALFTGRELDENVSLETPVPSAPGGKIERPELDLFQKQMNLINQQQKLLVARNMPKASIFGQGGYGRPGLNMLQNQFDWFYIAGLRLNWSLSGLYTFKKERQIIGLNSKAVQIQRDEFLLNTNTQLAQQQSEIEKLQMLIDRDKQIISLRQQVSTAAKAQLDNQVISASDYIREINAEDLARQTLITHQIQLIQAQLNYNTIAGI